MKHPGLAGTTLAVDSRLDRLAAIAGELDDRDLASEATAERQRLLGARFFAACVGQFKRGKSTLINALAGEDVLPVGVIPVTSVVTILSHGQTPSAMVRLFIHDKYVGELLRNTFLPTTRDHLKRIIQAMKDRDGIDGVLLAGTELPLLLTGDDACGVPLLDTTRIHVAAAVKRTWS